MASEQLWKLEPEPLDPDGWSRLQQATLTMHISQTELQKVQCLVSHGNQELDHAAMGGYTAIHHNDPSPHRL